MTHQILEHLSRFRVRWAVAAGVTVVAIALTAFAVGGGGGDRPNAVEGPRLSIAVVAPPERDVPPGEVMDVGRLNDGFDGQMPDRMTVNRDDVDLYAEQPAYVADDDRGDYGVDERHDDRQPYEASHQVDDRDRRDPMSGRPMSFGFDQAQPDWRAEREARRAALDARERDRADRRARRYDSSGGSSRDTDFY